MTTRRKILLPSRTIVIQEHTLAIVYPEGVTQVLEASVLRGSPNPRCGTIPFDPVLDEGKFRPATEQDFISFGVMFDPDYLTPVEALTWAPENTD